MDRSHVRAEARWRIKKPCPRRWEELEPTAESATRFCESCDLHVFDASSLSARAARRRVAASEGLSCMSLRYLPDGSVLHAESRVVTAIRGLCRAAVAAAAALLAACSARAIPENEAEHGVDSDSSASRLELLLERLDIDPRDLTAAQLANLEEFARLEESFTLTGYVTD